MLRNRAWARRALCLLASVALALSGWLPVTWSACAVAEETPADEPVYIAPTIAKDADPYDAEHPEDLQSEQLYAKSAILIEATTGEVIFEKNADDVMYPASTTKIMTVLLGIMLGDLGAEVTLSESAANIPSDSSTIPLKVGETINFQDLLFATMLRSGNEGANLIAETVSGDNYSFAELMNQAATMYGCTSTHFANPSGLHDDNHFTTARDMAKIAQAAMQNDIFRTIAKTYSYSLPRSNLQRSRVLVSGSDALLNPNIEGNEYYYPYAIGIKTGYHARAGYCYVGAAEKDGVELISVLFYTSRAGRWSDTIKLMDYGFSQFVSMTPMEMYNVNPLTVETSGFSLDDTDLGRLTLEVEPIEGTRTVHIVATKAEMEAMTNNLKQTVLVEYSRDFTAPIEKGEKVGTMTYYPADGGSAVKYNLVAGRSIARRENAPLSIAEIEAEVYADPNPFPPLSVEMALMVILPIGAVWLLIHLLRRLLRKNGRHKRTRVPKPSNRYFR